MSLLELGHWSWERPDADGVAHALLAHASCISVRIVPPGITALRAPIAPITASGVRP